MGRRGRAAGVAGALRRRGRAAAASGVVGAAVVLAACGSSSPGQSANPHAATSTTTAAPSSTSTTAAGSGSSTTAAPLFTQSGSGDAKTKPFTTTGRWQLTFDYTCAALGHEGAFTLNLLPSQGARVKVTAQQGLGGGGHRSYRAGTYSFSVATPCRWTVTATG